MARPPPLEEMSGSPCPRSINFARSRLDNSWSLLSYALFFRFLSSAFYITVPYATRSISSDYRRPHSAPTLADGTTHLSVTRPHFRYSFSSLPSGEFLPSFSNESSLLALRPGATSNRAAVLTLVAHPHLPFPFRLVALGLLGPSRVSRLVFRIKPTLISTFSPLDCGRQIHCTSTQTFALTMLPVCSQSVDVARMEVDSCTPFLSSDVLSSYEGFILKRSWSVPAVSL